LCEKDEWQLSVVETACEMMVVCAPIAATEAPRNKGFSGASLTTSVLEMVQIA